MNSWAPLWSFCVESSLWDEPDFVVKIFLTMMAVKDGDHICRFTAYQIGRKARKTEAEVLTALKILSSPDTKRKEKQQYDGRRIEAVEDGWLILNGEKYREMVSIEMTKARNRRSQKAFRERQKQKHGKGPGAREINYVRTLNEQGTNAAEATLHDQPNGSA